MTCIPIFFAFLLLEPCTDASSGLVQFDRGALT